MTPATTAVQRPADARLLVVDHAGRVAHYARAEFASLLGRGDLVIANDAATVPASLSGIHVATGSPVELRLAAAPSISPPAIGRFTAVAFGAGDFRMTTEERPLPPSFRPGDVLQLGPLQALVVRVLGHPRLIDVEFQGPAASTWEGLARYGRPIQYAYLQDPVAIWDTWTSFASVPAAFEAPSAGFLLDWRTIGALRAQGAAFATVTHAAGISSTGDPDLDAWLPLDEPYHIPHSTAALIHAARRRRDRIIAVGTTVVRALENAAAHDGCVHPGAALATLRVGAATPLRVVDAVVTGQHEAGTSHYELLRAFHGDDVLQRAVGEAGRMGYRSHEFGDSMLLERSGRFLLQRPPDTAHPTAA
jgi:S-adenosylmethionine:tRNA ribosyltransferase-isomerase